jgi:hypothetical protein
MKPPVRIRSSLAESRVKSGRPDEDLPIFARSLNRLARSKAPEDLASPTETLRFDGVLADDATLIGGRGVWV